MLAAECAWAVLRTEHARIRRLLASVEGALKAGAWRRPGLALDRLRNAVQHLRDFDDETHRPKGVVLVATLRGRSAEVDDLLEQLERQRKRCDELLSRSMALLDRLDGGDERAAPALESALREHHDLTLDHLRKEDTVLHSQTARLLTEEEWSRVVSSISSVVAGTHRRKARPGR